ncbi:MAG TPA: zf-HC2 domain-containing protein [Holophaga sp.]|nr:zf-HC2 domain-containing protein [Holophaga sp.]
MKKAFWFIPSCPEVEEELTEYLEGAPPFRRRLGIRVHLLICRACDALRRVLEALPALGRKALEAPEAPAPEAREALAGALARIREGGPGGRDCGC